MLLGEIAALICLGVSFGAERQVRLPAEISIERAEVALRSKGFKVDSVGRNNGVAFIFLAKDEARDPQPVIEDLLDESSRQLRRLVAKLRGGTLSPAEKEELLMLLAEKVSALLGL